MDLGLHNPLKRPTVQSSDLSSTSASAPGCSILQVHSRHEGHPERPDRPSNNKVGETDGDEAWEDQSPDQGHSPDVVTPRSKSVGHGAPWAINSESAGADEVAIVKELGNVEAVAVVASVAPLLPWIGKTYVIVLLKAVSQRGIDGTDILRPLVVNIL